jgi:hypothetical protein
MTNYKYLFLITLALIFGCSSQKTGNTVSSKKLTHLLERKLGNKINKEDNFDKTYVLAWNEDTESGISIIRYGVWVIATGELLYAGSAIKGSVVWLDNKSLLVEDYPGIVDGEEQKFKFKVDLETKIKTPIYEKKDL